MSHDSKDDDLFGRTWKTVVVLVGVCIVFVGGLSATAMFVTDRALAPKAQSADEADKSDKTSKDAKSSDAKTPAKKPVSI